MARYILKNIKETNPNINIQRGQGYFIWDDIKNKTLNLQDENCLGDIVSMLNKYFTEIEDVEFTESELLEEPIKKPIKKKTKSKKKKKKQKSS